MNKQAIFHLNDSPFCFANSLDSLVIRLKTAKDDPDIRSIKVMVMRKFAIKQIRHYYDMVRVGSDDLFDYYETRLRISDSRLMYGFVISDSKGEDHLFGEMGFCHDFDDYPSGSGYFQMPYVNATDVIGENGKFAGRVFYQIFPDRFARDEKGPGNPTMKWGEKPDRMHFAGGNIQGIMEKLDYLRELGIGGIYFTPLWKSDSNHRYDTLSYGEVDPRLGTNEDLVKLVDECHKRDILVVFDLVYNHVSYRHPFFQDVLKNGRRSKYYEWFIVHKDPVKFADGYFEHFGKAPFMPKLNMSNPECAKYFVDVATDIVRRYGNDGYRIDVADEIAHGFFNKLNQAMREIDRDFLLISEDWHEASTFLNSGHECDGVMNYSLRALIIEAFAERKMNPSDFVEGIHKIWYRYKEGTNLRMLNLLSSHDVPRYLNICGHDIDRYLASFAFLLLFPGIPYIYYGDERGMDGCDDPDCRKCVLWDENNLVIYRPIRELVRFRNALGKGFKGMNLKEEKGVLILETSYEGGSASLVINLSGHDVGLSSQASPSTSRLYESNKLKDLGFALFLNLKASLFTTN